MSHTHFQGTRLSIQLNIHFLQPAQVDSYYCVALPRRRSSDLETDAILANLSRRNRSERNSGTGSEGVSGAADERALRAPPRHPTKAGHRAAQTPIRTCTVPACKLERDRLAARNQRRDSPSGTPHPGAPATTTQPPTPEPTQLPAVASTGDGAELTAPQGARPRTPASEHPVYIDLSAFHRIASRCRIRRRTRACPQAAQHPTSSGDNEAGAQAAEELRQHGCEQVHDSTATVQTAALARSSHCLPSRFSFRRTRSPKATGKPSSSAA